MSGELCSLSTLRTLVMCECYLDCAAVCRRPEMLLGISSPWLPKVNLWLAGRCKMMCSATVCRGLIRPDATGHHHTPGAQHPTFTRHA